MRDEGSGTVGWKDSWLGDAPEVRQCFCVGPQRGEPLCPCQMREKHKREVSLLVDGITINGRRYRLVEEK
jgi:hypothetical protein